MASSHIAEEHLPIIILKVHFSFHYKVDIRRELSIFVEFFLIRVDGF